MRSNGGFIMKGPYIKVTYLGKGWGVRCFAPDGKNFTEGLAKTKDMIGNVARDLLRFCDKGCGPSEATKYTDRARHRAWEKARNCDDAQDAKLRNMDMGLKRFDSIPLESH
jgi:hypothetical protein